MKNVLRIVLALVLVLMVSTGLMIGCGQAISSSERAHRTGYGQSDAPVRHAPLDVTDARPGVRLPPGTALDRNEELWVIERRSAPPVVQNPRADDLPGAGALMAQPEGQPQPVPCPLKHTDVKASILGYVAAVDVTQQYVNPFPVKIEATYVFPLPHNAAVSEFVMMIGERKIRGIIREREEAKRIYEQAKSAGHVASLLTQERPNIFTQAVANIEPGRQIDVNIRYFHTLAYNDGWYEFVFPMVVGPRFNPPGTADGVGAVARGNRGGSGQAAEVTYLRPTERSGHDLALSVEINGGVKLENVQCNSHEIKTTANNATKTTVTLAAGPTIPNKDFVLRYQVAGREVKGTLMTYRDARGGFFTLMLVPPAAEDDVPRRPVEMVFTLDTSGSMQGKPLEQSKSAILHALAKMQPTDALQVVRFGDQAETLFPDAASATPENLHLAHKYVQRMQAGGGTMMVNGVRASLFGPASPERPRYVAFLTDGYIGNERDVLREINANLGQSRIFSFGVGSSTNRYLLEHMAKTGRGAAAFLSLEDKGSDVMEQFFSRISHPAMTDITIDFGGMNVVDLYPRKLPDLFVGRPVIIAGRFNGDAANPIKIRGTVGGQPREITVAPDAGNTPAHSALAAVWARKKIADLAESMTLAGNAEAPEQIKQIALSHGLLSPFTAFVAVDAATRTAGTIGVSVPVPVNIPDGVPYETTVQEKQTTPPSQRQPGADQ